MKKKIILLGGILFSSAVLMSGCDLKEVENDLANRLARVSIPFEWFQKENPAEIIPSIPDVKGLSIEKETVDLKGLESIQNLIHKMENILTNQEKYLSIGKGEQSLYEILGNEIFSKSHPNESDVITQTIQQMASVDHQWIHHLTLRQYGEREINGNRVSYAVVDLNAVNDTEDFHIQSFQWMLDKEGRIQSVIPLGSPIDHRHTATPLTKDSILDSDTHQAFSKELEKVIKRLANPSLYEQIRSNALKPDGETIVSLTKRLGVEAKNQSTIYTLVEQGKGTMEHWAITGYLWDDKNVTAKTLYELTLSDEKGYHFYTVHYERGTKRITNIEKGSPFKEESP